MDISSFYLFIYTCRDLYKKWEGKKLPKILENSPGGTFESIIDMFNSYEAVRKAIKDAGLNKCSLIFGIDYTNSNKFQGQKTFNGKSLHELEPSQMNPYQQVITYLGETLEEFDEDGIIPAFGFGDRETKDKSVFPIKEPDGCCDGFNGVLEAYEEITPGIKLSGPTNFAPLIMKAIEIVSATRKVCSRNISLTISFSDLR